MKNLFRWSGAALLAATIGFVPVVQSASAQEDIGDDQVWLVDGISGDDMNSGKGSWANARETIQSVRDDGDLVAGDRIWVRATTYTLTSGISMKDGVWLLGGFAGTETSQFDADPYANPTILDGNDTATHVVTATDLYATLTRLDGFIITGGDADGEDEHAHGGGLLYLATEPPLSRLTVTRCRFENNAAAAGGGAVAVIRPHDEEQQVSFALTFTNCEFTDNTATDGAGVWTHGGVVQINNSLFVGNTARGDCIDISIDGGARLTLVNMQAVVRDETANPDRAGEHVIDERMLLAIIRSLTPGIVAAR